MAEAAEGNLLHAGAVCAGFGRATLPRWLRPRLSGGRDGLGIGFLNTVLQLCFQYTENRKLPRPLGGLASVGDGAIRLPARV